MPTELETLRAELASLRSEVEALREDKADLDWLLSHGLLVKMGGEDWNFVPIRHDEDGRAAIRAARGKR